MKAEKWVFGFIFIFFLIVTPVYYFMSKEIAGTFVLGFTGLLGGMIAGYLALTARSFDPRPEDRRDAERLGDRPVGVETQLLRQGRDRPGDVDAAGGGGELTGDEAQQRRLAGAVAADETGAAVAEGAADVVERAGAVGPVEGQ